MSGKQHHTVNAKDKVGEKVDKDHRGRPIPKEFYLLIGDFSQSVISPDQTGVLKRAKESGYTVAGPYRLVKKKPRRKQARSITKR